MNIRMPTTADAARILREALAEKGVDLKHTQALEVIARLQGYRNSHVMNADKRFDKPMALKATASDQFELRTDSSFCQISADMLRVRVSRGSEGVTVAVLAQGEPTTKPLFTQLYRNDAIQGSMSLTSGMSALTSTLQGLKGQFTAMNEEDPWCECADCMWRGRESQLKDLRDVFERVLPGEDFPAGECPECGAVAHILDDQSEGHVPAVYASQDVPGNWGFVGCDSDCYETEESALEPARQSVSVEVPLASCPGCGTSTVPNVEGLTDEQAMCGRCLSIRAEAEARNGS
jgi:Zn finger protein HypA/HybF involved in hydrogenase expression